MRVSVIISTYNQPRWLEKVVWGFGAQDHRDMELIIADDGSSDETRGVIERLRAETGLALEHVWHEDRGFRKCAILNKAVERATSQYLLFTDGDCIPRRDFVSVHASRARNGWMLSGGYVKLPMDVSKAITREDIASGRVFDAAWLRARGVRGGLTMTKLMARGVWADLLNALTTTRPTWNGHNSSGWKSDIIRVNGFDERMEYGGEDREMGERLTNAGVRARQIRYSAVCVHLDHARSYRNDAALARNLDIRRVTRAVRSTWTDFGIRKGANA
jgi:glycosyltransferase involved in cell wall biosynthesis